MASTPTSVPALVPRSLRANRRQVQFVAAYQRLVERGCTEIVSIHIAERAMSGTIGSATIAASAVDVPVHIIDTGSASFGVAVCVWAAGVAVG